MPTALLPAPLARQVVASYHNDHVYAFDISGAGAAGPALAAPLPAGSVPPTPTPSPAATGQPSGSGSGGPLPPELRLDFFGQGAVLPAASSRLALYRGVLGGTAGGAAGEASALPGMLPPAAEAAKADGNLHFFNKQVRRYAHVCRLRVCAGIGGWVGRASSGGVREVPGWEGRWVDALTPSGWRAREAREGRGRQGPQCKAGLCLSTLRQAWLHRNKAAAPVHCGIPGGCCHACCPQYPAAIQCYTQAIQLAPQSSVLYTNRWVAPAEAACKCVVMWFKYCGKEGE